MYTDYKISWFIGIVFLFQVAISSSVAAQTVHSVAVNGSTLTATLELPLGVEADLTIEFEQVIGLSAQSLGLSVAEIDPTDVFLLNRLPELGGVPTAFPLMLTIEPPATGPLTFTGVVEVELYTKNLHYTAGSPLRLWKAPVGGDFVDITEFTGAGSYRVRGTSGGFSEFVIGIEGRTSSAVIEAKYAALRNRLAATSTLMPTAVADLLEDLLDESELGGYLLGDLDAAVDSIDEFLQAIDQHRATGEIPDVWRASRDLTNVAGELSSLARTLRYSLRTAA